jgi:hypothetical protein
MSSFMRVGRKSARIDNEHQQIVLSPFFSTPDPSNLISPPLVRPFGVPFVLPLLLATFHPPTPTPFPPAVISQVIAARQPYFRRQLASVDLRNACYYGSRFLHPHDGHSLPVREMGFLITICRLSTTLVHCICILPGTTHLRLVSLVPWQQIPLRHKVTTC